MEGAHVRVMNIQDIRMMKSTCTNAKIVDMWIKKKGDVSVIANVNKVYIKKYFSKNHLQWVSFCLFLVFFLERTKVMLAIKKSTHKMVK